MCVLGTGGSWVGGSRVISTLSKVISRLTQLVTPLIATHVPPSSQV